jgi:hypothetical protein
MPLAEKSWLLLLISKATVCADATAEDSHSTRVLEIHVPTVCVSVPKWQYRPTTFRNCAPATVTMVPAVIGPFGGSSEVTAVGTNDG